MTIHLYSIAFYRCITFNVLHMKAIGIIQIIGGLWGVILCAMQVLRVFLESKEYANLTPIFIFLLLSLLALWAGILLLDSLHRKRGIYLSLIIHLLQIPVLRTSFITYFFAMGPSFKITYHESGSYMFNIFTVNFLAMLSPEVSSNLYSINLIALFIFCFLLYSLLRLTKAEQGTGDNAITSSDN